MTLDTLPGRPSVPVWQEKNSQLRREMAQMQGDVEARYARGRGERCGAALGIGMNYGPILTQPCAHLMGEGGRVQVPMPAANV